MWFIAAQCSAVQCKGITIIELQTEQIVQKTIEDSRGKGGEGSARECGRGVS